VALLAVVIGLYWLISGVMSIYVAISNRALPHRGWAFGLGALGMAAGIVVLSYPVQSAAAITRLLGIWLVLIGVVELTLAFVVRSGERRAARV
jgi:uncharacterized membrane protein HdeD (DUF308 family)